MKQVSVVSDWAKTGPDEDQEQITSCTVDAVQYLLYINDF
jgi:hypothetical protein